MEVSDDLHVAERFAELLFELFYTMYYRYLIVLFITAVSMQNCSLSVLILVWKTKKM